MNDVSEFIEVRQGIESIAREIAVLVLRKARSESKTRLDEATELLERLTKLADNDVQENAVTRLTHLLGGLQKKVAALESKKRVAKEPLVS